MTLSSTSAVKLLAGFEGELLAPLAPAERVQFVQSRLLANHRGSDLQAH